MTLSNTPKSESPIAAAPDQSGPDSLARYLGRLHAFHAVLEIAAPGQPRFEDVMPASDSTPQYRDAALDAVHRRLGAAISRLSADERESLRAAVAELGRRTAHGTAQEADADYRQAVELAYRQIVGAIDMRVVSSEWLV